MNALSWMGEHPILTLFLAYTAAWTIVNGLLAIASIWNGKPPTDCDCD